MPRQQHRSFGNEGKPKAQVPRLNFNNLVRNPTANTYEAAQAPREDQRRGTGSSQVPPTGNLSSGNRTALQPVARSHSQNASLGLRQGSDQSKVFVQRTGIQHRGAHRLESLKHATSTYPQSVHNQSGHPTVEDKFVRNIGMRENMQSLDHRGNAYGSRVSGGTGSCKKGIARAYSRAPSQVSRLVDDAHIDESSLPPILRSNYHRKNNSAFGAGDDDFDQRGGGGIGKNRHNSKQQSEGSERHEDVIPGHHSKYGGYGSGSGMIAGRKATRGGGGQNTHQHHHGHHAPSYQQVSNKNGLGRRMNMVRSLPVI